MAIRISTKARNAICDAIVDLVDGGGAPGWIIIWTGSAPTTPDDPDSGTNLATIDLQATAFDAAGSAGGNADGETVLLGVPLSDTSANGSGNAGHFRVYDGSSVCILQGTCGQGTGDMQFDNVAIVATGTVTITSFSLTQPAE